MTSITQVGPTDASSNPLLVLEVSRSPHQTLLRAVDTLTGEQLSISLLNEWSDSPVEQSHIFRVILTEPEGTFSQWDFSTQSTYPISVTRERNLFVLHPDTLISATAVADSFLCLRKTVLTARTPSGSLATTAAGSEAALFGNLIHDMLQIILAKDSNMRSVGASGSLSQSGVDTESFFEAVEDVVYRHCEALYGASVSDNHARLVLHKIVPDMMEWYAAFMGSGNYMATEGVEISQAGKSTNVVISHVQDIEELIWSPVLGLKGKIDASVNMRLDGVDSGVGAFELKTGKSSGYSALSHNAQVTLYYLLMSDRNGRFINFGLLSYIRYQEALRSIRKEEGFEQPSSSDMTLVTSRPNMDQGPKNRCIVAVRGEVVGLIMHRNSLARFLRLDADIEELPPMLVGREQLCVKCFSKESCMMQHKLLETATSESVKNGPGEELFNQNTASLTASHADYYRYWRCLLADEEEHAGRQMKDIWTMPGFQREREGACVCNLLLEPDEISSQVLSHGLLSPGQGTEVKFTRHPNGVFLSDISLCGISKGDFIIVSAENKKSSRHCDKPQETSIATWQSGLTNGFVESVTSTCLSVSVERSLVAWCVHQEIEVSDVFWRVDRAEIYASHNTSKRTLENLFCENDDGMRRLRNLIVDGAAPNFGNLREVVKGDEGNVAEEKFNLRLNEEQRHALEMSLRAKDYVLILGMPGTGKTTTLASVVLTKAMKGETVLLCSHTNTAVDNILERFLDVGFQDFIRLGRNLSVISSRIHPYHVSKMCTPGTSTAVLEQSLNAPRVVATTCLSINHPILIRRSKFDLVVIDEASQILQSICIGPLQFTEGPFLLVGDHYQLPPLQREKSIESRVSRLQNKECPPNGSSSTKLRVTNDADVSELGESLFRRLCVKHPEAMVSLSKQYRMAYEIMDCCNTLVYNGSLSCGSERVASQRLQMSSSFSQNCSPWEKAVQDPIKRLVFLNTQEGEQHGAGNSINPEPISDDDDMSRNEGESSRQSDTEVSIVLASVRLLLWGGVDAKDISVLSPFRAQVVLIRKHLLNQASKHENKLLEVEVFTVDQYQGKDNKCIILSFVRNSLNSVGPLLKDWRRINVALTRAKQKLILIGAEKTLMKGGYFLTEMMMYLHRIDRVFPVVGNPGIS